MTYVGKAEPITFFTNACNSFASNISYPTLMEMNRLTQKIGFRVARYLEKAKLIERDAENIYFAVRKCAIFGGF